MSDAKITLQYNKHRLKAIATALECQCQTVGEELYSKLDELYESVVPKNERVRIENLITDEFREAEEAKEAARHFAVMHICEKGLDIYFTSDIFDSFHSAAYRYRLYSRKELDSSPTLLADAFPGSTILTEQQYEKLLDSMPADHRIMVALDFDLDENQVSVYKPMSGLQKTYDLHDVSVAAYKAFRGDYHTATHRAELFADALEGKELEIEPIGIQM